MLSFILYDWPPRGGSNQSYANNGVTAGTGVTQFESCLNQTMFTIQKTIIQVQLKLSIEIYSVNKGLKRRSPTEVYIFQCKSTYATEVADQGAYSVVSMKECNINFISRCLLRSINQHVQRRLQVCINHHDYILPCVI